jgi:hypothetical protein
MEPQLQNGHPQQHKFKCGGIRHSPSQGTPMRRCVYSSKATDLNGRHSRTISQGEIDTLALKRYCKSHSNPQKVSTSNSPRKSTSRCTREAPLAEASRTKLGDSPQATAAKGFPVNRRRAQPQTHGSDMDHISQGPDENIT